MGDVLAGIFFVAIIYVLARPGSKAAEAVTEFSRAMTALVRTATDL